MVQGPRSVIHMRSVHPWTDISPPEASAVRYVPAWEMPLPMIPRCAAAEAPRTTGARQGTGCWPPAGGNNSQTCG